MRERTFTSPGPWLRVDPLPFKPNSAKGWLTFEAAPAAAGGNNRDRICMHVDVCIFPSDNGCEMSLGVPCSASGFNAHGRPIGACAACVKHNSRSQHGEERRLLPELRAAAGSGRGVFVELGALDGIKLSNTYLLEHCFGWSGVLIEANNQNFLKLMQSGRNRSTLVHSAVCASPGTVSMTRSGGSTAARVDRMSKAFSKKWHRSSTIPTDQVPCKSLSAIMHDAGYDRATFLSLDVEGSEYDVLTAADPTAFEVLMVEWGANVKLNAKVHALLAHAGMRLHREWSVGYVSLGGNSRVHVTQPHTMTTPPHSVRIRIL